MPCFLLVLTYGTQRMLWSKSRRPRSHGFVSIRAQRFTIGWPLDRYIFEILSRGVIKNGYKPKETNKKPRVPNIIFKSQLTDTQSSCLPPSWMAVLDQWENMSAWAERSYCMTILLSRHSMPRLRLLQKRLKLTGNLRVLVISLPKKATRFCLKSEFSLSRPTARFAV